MHNDPNRQRAPDVSQLLIRCFSAVFPQLNRTEIGGVSQSSMASWDSLATVTLVSVIQDEFGVEFQPDEIESLSSFDIFLKRLLIERNVPATKD